MAFQPFNYAQLPVMGMENIQQGMQTAMAPFDAHRKAQAAQLANQLVAMQLEYMPQEAEAAIAYKQAQTQAAQQEAQKQRMFIEYLSGGMGAGSGMGQQSPLMGQPGMGAEQQMGGAPMQGMGQPSMQMNQGQGMPMGGPGPMQAQMPSLPSQQEMYFRRALGLSELTPHEQLAMDLYKSQAGAMANKSIENMYGTPQTMSTKQGQVLGIQQLMPILEELKHLDVPGQRGIPSFTSPNEQARYNQLVSSALETYVSSKGLASNEKSLHAALNVLERKGGESLENYRDRLSDTEHELASIFQEITGDSFVPTRQQRERKGSNSKGGKSKEMGLSFIQMQKGGKIYDIPMNDVEEAMQMGYEIGR